MTAPGGPENPGGPGGPSGFAGPRPLAAEADRERLLALLREHYAVGLFGLEELDHRVGVVLGARYLDEAATAVADLPGVVSGRSSPRRVRRGHAHADQPAAGWIPTDERFRDPTSRAVMRVWIDPADQTRHYIPEPDA